MRRLEDHSLCYCIAETGTRDEILRIEMLSEDSNEKLKVESIFESPNSKFKILVADPDNKRNLFILTDD